MTVKEMEASAGDHNNRNHGPPVWSEALGYWVGGLQAQSSTFSDSLILFVALSILRLTLCTCKQSPDLLSFYSS